MNFILNLKNFPEVFTVGDAVDILSQRYKAPLKAFVRA